MTAADSKNFRTARIAVWADGTFSQQRQCAFTAARVRSDHLFSSGSSLCIFSHRCNSPDADHNNNGHIVTINITTAIR